LTSWPLRRRPAEHHEFVDVMTAARSQISSTRRDLASFVDGGASTGNHRFNGAASDVVAQVRNLVASD
jgi:hypothetical protein